MHSPYFFPDPNLADASGRVATTSKVSPGLLLAAYRQGLFPWTHDPVGWYSPDPRAVFVDVKPRLPSNLGRLFRRSRLQISCDRAFVRTMRACQAAHRHSGEWIRDSWVPAYAALHAAGFAHSVEVWRGEALVGGIYGVHIAGVFSAESMFHHEDNASKYALAVLAGQLRHLGVQLLDVQVLNPHTARVGAEEISRRAYLRALRAGLALSMAQARWAAAPLAWGDLLASPNGASLRARQGGEGQPGGATGA